MSRRAERELVAALSWWEENRPAARGLLLDELETALGLLASQPFAGRAVRSSKRSGLRRLLLRRVRYFVYYQLSRSEDAVEILALWHAERGRRPRL